MTTIAPQRLDDWYKTINKIYLDQNYYRHPESVFSHLVEIVGGLSLLASDRQKPGVDPREHIAKALGWWMALCGKMRIRSVEDLIWSKYPFLCPYCLQIPHNDEVCTNYKTKNSHPDWETLGNLGSERRPKKPRTLGEWSEMFNSIYPVNIQSENYSVIFARFAEELGELSEATRLFQLQPGFFFSEAADFFAWLMHLHTLYVRKQDKTLNIKDSAKLLEHAMIQQYPLHCRDCGKTICVCPPVLKRTLGRIAHDLPLYLVDSVHEPLLKLQEAMEIFNPSVKTVKIGENEFNVDKEFIGSIYTMVEGINNQISLLVTSDGQLNYQMVLLLNEIKNLSETERVSQEKINELVDTMRGLPSEQRSILVSILSGFVTNGWSVALMEAMKGLLS